MATFDITVILSVIDSLPGSFITIGSAGDYCSSLSIGSTHLS
jgi:hypothetical protein